MLLGRITLWLPLLFGCTSMEMGVASREMARGDDAYGYTAAPSAEAAAMDAPLLKLADHDAGPAAPQVEAPRDARQVIYVASLRLVVVSASAAQASVKSLAEAAGGYLQESDARGIVVRVPAVQFEPLLASIAQLGEVVDRAVKASDVTEQLLELDIRLDNARRARERLLAHLEKSEKMEDTLRIEAELARVTTEIEQLEGKLRYLRSQVAMSTIRVEFNSPAPLSESDAGALGVPFEWVGRLGDGLVAGAVESRPRKPGIFSGGPRFDPPAEFIRYYSDSNLVEAMNAEGVRLKVQRNKNYDKGALAFWRKLARTALVRVRSLDVTEELDLGDDRSLIAGVREVAGAEYGYLLVLVRSRELVFTVEAWGPRAAFDAQAAALRASALTLKR